MRNFEQLESAVSDGAVRIIHIEAIPRSVSTALGRALNESDDSPSVNVHEPFNRMKLDIDTASGHVLDAIEPLARSDTRQVTVIAKSMARNLSSPDLFRQWVSICDGVAWSVRDPLVQIGSFLTRIANDLFVEPGADVITQEELAPYLPDAVAYLKDGGTLPDFSKTSWADIGQHFRSGHQPERSVVVDGAKLTIEPLKVLENACIKLGLTFSPYMMEGWQQGFANANTGYSEKYDNSDDNGWIGRAASSTGIVAVERHPLELSELPPSLREHITEVAMPTYQEMIGAE